MVTVPLPPTGTDAHTSSGDRGIIAQSKRTTRPSAGDLKCARALVIPKKGVVVTVPPVIVTPPPLIMRPEKDRSHHHR